MSTRNGAETDMIEATSCPNCNDKVFVPDYARQGTPLRCLKCKTSFFYEPGRDHHGIRASLAPSKGTIPQRRSQWPMTTAARQAGAAPGPQRPQEATEGPVAPSSSPAAPVAKGETGPGVDVEAPPQPPTAGVVYGSPWKRFQGEMRADVQAVGLEATRSRWVGRGISAKWFNRFVGVNTAKVASATAKERRASAGRNGAMAPKVADADSTLAHLLWLLERDVQDLKTTRTMNNAVFVRALAQAVVDIIALEGS